ncbi:membrane associated protein [Escherichia phage vB_EcoS_G29-2]|uniref:Uncharacterized protein n=2 Tax=Hanrivervirus TaxID=2560145 RepID=A0A482N7L8_9CAUD|nr:membrane associated protein [Escherichia phage vB_EcoS_G29-2]YP_009901707.1 membrane associated protein [Escherichia phage herni]QBQ81502.1 hypothetical protein G292_00048 [Escherichia phage vB_EcoS_G29-2]QHR74809.1 putative membrane associated protein [Escherichia phage herni]
MAEYGAMLSLSNGNPFITPKSTPFCLYGKYTYSSSGTSAYHSASANIPLNQSYPCMAFIKTTNTQQPTALIAYRNGGNIYVNGGNPYGQSFTMTVYIFAIFPQTLPKYGMAIWDASGKLVLTNESRVLTDLVTIGTPGSSGGTNIDQTLSGSYAVCPSRLGAVVGMGASDIYTSCRYDGSSTRIGAARTTPGTGSITNNGNSIIAIRTDIYDQ